MFDAVSKPTLRPRASASDRSRVLVLLGTRPEAIKLAPVIHELKRRSFPTVVVSSSQHKQILKPFLASLNIEVDHDLAVMRRDQSLNTVCSRVVAKLDKILKAERPDLILVQGDTTTTLGGALAGFNRQIPVGHLEAGLRSGNMMSPFPEEMNRRMVSQVASFHFAATEENRRNLLDAGVEKEKIFVTGNSVVDSLHYVMKDAAIDPSIEGLIDATKGTKRILLTTHRRESFGQAMTRNLKIIREFVDENDDVSLLFPVHPNPNVKNAAKEILGGHDRIHLLAPLDYSNFLAVMRAAWLIISDSGGVQEEAPSLGKPLLILRENTERPEAVSSGIAKLVGSNGALGKLLKESYADESWIRSVKQITNPFGDGRSAERIVNIIESAIAIRAV